MCAGHQPLERGCDWWCGDQSLHWALGKASALFVAVTALVRGRFCSSVVGVESFRSVSELRGEGALLGEGIPIRLLK